MYSKCTQTVLKHFFGLEYTTVVYVYVRVCVCVNDGSDVTSYLRVKEEIDQ